MKKIKVLLVSLCIAILIAASFTACSKKQISSEINNSNQSVIIPTQILNDLNINVVFNQPTDFIDPNANYYSSNLLNTSTLKDYKNVGFNHFINNQNVENTTIISIVFSESGFDANYFPVLYLKAVPKKTLTEKNNLIKISNENYSKKELQQYIFFEDEQNIVYDISKLISVDSISSRVSILNKNIDEYDYSYLEKQANKILANKDNFISFSYEQAKNSDMISDSNNKKIVEFTNKELEKVIKINLNIKDSDPIYSDQIENLLYLNYISPESSNTDTEIANDSDWSPLNSIAEIDKLKNLIAISLPDSKIKNLNPLKSLKNLKALNLSGNEITDISDLKDIDTIEILNLSNNKLTSDDITHFKSINALHYLNLKNNGEINSIYSNF